MRENYRMFTQPTIIFGLDVEDIVVLIPLCMITASFIHAVLGIILFLSGWFFLPRIKNNNPPGILLHLIYHVGLLNIQGVLKSTFWVKRYGAFRKK